MSDLEPTGNRNISLESKNCLKPLNKEETRLGIKKIAEFINKNRPNGSVVIITGEWGVGKTTFGKILAESSNSIYLDGDNFSKNSEIMQKLSGNIKRDTCTIIGASFSETWISESTISELKIANRLLIVNITADDKTRYENMYMRKQGYKPGSNFKPEVTLKHIQESPNYISPLADVVLNFSKNIRPSTEEQHLILQAEINS